ARLAGPVRKNAGPGDGEPIRVGTEVLHQRHILFVPVIVVVCDVTCVAVLDLARCVRVRVPDRRTLAILIPRALDLIRRSARAPIKPAWKFPRNWRCRSRVRTLDGLRSSYRRT